MKKTLLTCLLTLTIVSCGNPVIQCSDEAVIGVVSEIATDLYIEQNNQASAEQFCAPPNNGLLNLQGINCGQLFGSVASEIFYPDQVKVSGMRTTSESESGIQYCAADLEYVFNDRDIATLVAKYFNAASISAELKKQYIEVFSGVGAEALQELSQKTAGTYDVQLTDDGVNFYVNLEVAEIPSMF